ncbi:oxidoreductase-like protein [Xylariaceae sp. FL0804]|nr:oxidoreductase-like protein [Xylariaceae sp. FL0804]
MGLLGGWFSSSEDEKRKQEVVSGARAPDRSERQQCWDARDRFFACLDKHDIVDSVGGEGAAAAAKHCAAEDKFFHENCAKAWVHYFKKWRIADIKKKQTLNKLEAEGAYVRPSDPSGNPK